jgi:hypothetical protein
MGRPVDMAAMVTKNEKVRAVGNMRVNARGDLLDHNNQIIQDSTTRVAENYNQTVNSQAPKPAHQSAPVIRNQIDLSELNDSEREVFEDDTEVIKKD